MVDFSTPAGEFGHGFHFILINTGNLTPAQTLWSDMIYCTVSLSSFNLPYYYFHLHCDITKYVCFRCHITNLLQTNHHEGTGFNQPITFNPSSCFLFVCLFHIFLYLFLSWSTISALHFSLLVL